MKTSIYYFETTDGPRLVKAETLGIARHHVIQGYIKDVRKATVKDMADLAQNAGGIVIDDTTTLPNVIGIGSAQAA